MKARAAPLRALRSRACRSCKQKFNPRRSRQVVCENPECAIVEGRRQALKEVRAQQKIDRERIKPHGVLLKEADRAFNAYIRFRDRDDPCISCGEKDPPQSRGGAWDCGHYMPRGVNSALRYCEKNANKQCKKCNGGAGRAQRTHDNVTKAYRVRLIMKVGLACVRWLEGTHQPRKYTKDELREIRERYKSKLKTEKKALAELSEPGP